MQRRGHFILIQGTRHRQGKGVWSKNVSLSPGKITWNWDGQDLDKFSLWLKVTFSDHKSIYYVAAGSMNPQSEGEYYRDQGKTEGAFLHQSIISGTPMSTVERDLFEDYEKYWALQKYKD